VFETGIVNCIVFPLVGVIVRLLTETVANGRAFPNQLFGEDHSSSLASPVHVLVTAKQFCKKIKKEKKKEFFFPATANSHCIKECFFIYKVLVVRNYFR
jgi:hypothetical protein